MEGQKYKFSNVFPNDVKVEIENLDPHPISFHH